MKKKLKLMIRSVVQPEVAGCGFNSYYFLSSFLLQLQLQLEFRNKFEF